MTTELSVTPLQADLVQLLRATRSLEQDLFAGLPAEMRDRPSTIGEWSAKDVLAHVGAWRAIEARRLEAMRRGQPISPDDPAPSDDTDASNLRLHAVMADAPWRAVDAAADDSLEALIKAIGDSTTEILCECDNEIAGIGSNGANHATAHLSDVAKLAGAGSRYRDYASQIEEILARGHLPPRDSGVMLYNLACHHAMANERRDAVRLLGIAFRLRPDLAGAAVDDPDLISIRDSLPAAAASG